MLGQLFPLNYWSAGGATSSYEPETLAYAALRLAEANPMSDAEKASLDLVIKDVKGDGTTIASVACNLSTVAGTAFLTNPVFTSTGIPSNDLRWTLGFKLSIAAGGKTLVGWSKAAGTGETYTSLVTGFTNGSTHPFETFTPNGVVATDFDVLANSNGQGRSGATQSAATVRYALYKIAMNLTLNSGTLTNTVYTTGTGTATFSPSLIVPKLVEGSNVHYLNSSGVASGSGFIISEVNSITTSGFSFSQVLTPNAAGITIVSASGGTTYNWTSDDGIDPNAAAFAITVTKD